MSQNVSRGTTQHEPFGLESRLEALQANPEFRDPVESLDGHRCNDHFAQIYESSEEKFATAVPFVRQGLEGGERCMYVIDESSEEEVLAAMRAAGVDVDAALDSGALTFHTIQDTYLRNDAFDPDEMIDFYAEAIEEVVSEYEALRVAAETTWLQEETTTIEDFMAYESKINDLFDDEDCLALCQYDRNGFAPEVIRDIVQTHPHLIYDGTVCHNFYYTPPEEFFSPDQPAREVERMLGMLLDRTRAKTKLAGHERFLHELYDVTASQDRSFEEKLHALFELGCERFDLDLGALNLVDPDADRLEIEYASGDHSYFEVGGELPLSQTYCQAATDIREAASVSDPVAEGFDDILVYEDFGVEGYLGTYIPVDGGSDRTLAFVPDGSGVEPFSEQDRTYLELMGQWVGYELNRQQREQFLRECHEITSNPDHGFEAKLERLVELGCERFGLDAGGLCRVDADSDFLEVETVIGDHDVLEPGLQADLTETYCQVPTAASADSDAAVTEPVHVTDPEPFEGKLCYEVFGIRTYLGTHLELDGAPNRTFWLVSNEPRDEPITDEERTFHRLMGQWVKYELERQGREKQLAALNDMSRELMNAETQAEIADVVTNHARGSLQLPITALVSYDRQQGTLSPAAQTPRAEDELPTAMLCAPESGPLWETFVANETRILDDVSAISGAGVGLGEVFAVPLGREGLFVTATTSDGFSTAGFDFVRATVATVKAAYTRASREQLLHEREATLEEQNETLERLNRVNNIIRNIDKALVQASTRTEIETVVCKQLADVGPYELAWIGEHDPVTDEITPRRWAGTEKGYLEEITVAVDHSPEGQGPGGRAVRTREPQVANDILDDPEFKPYRKAALKRGYHAHVALPLVYEDTLYGILNVYAGQPGVFDQLERSVLTELSDNIAHAINAVESKKALVSEAVTELKFDVHDTDVDLVELSSELDCTITLEGVIPRPDGQLRIFFSVRGVPAATFADAAARLPVRNMSLISEHEEDGDPVGLFEGVPSDESFYARILEHGGIPREIVVGREQAHVLVELAADAATREFVEMFRTSHPGAELVAQRSRECSPQSQTEVYLSLTDSLTDRQLEVLQTAYFSGYFEKPRTRTGSEIATSLDITQPTFNHHVRAAQRKFCRALFEDDGSLGVADYDVD